MTTDTFPLCGPGANAAGRGFLIECWARVDNGDIETHPLVCAKPVDPGPDGIGLCEKHLALYRGDEPPQPVPVNWWPAW